MEFEFDYPFQPSEDEILAVMKTRSISHDEAFKHIYQENWIWKRRKLQLESRCLSSMLERLFSTKKYAFWKIIVNLVENRHSHEPKNLLGVLNVEEPIVYSEYNSKDDKAKLAFLLNSMKRAIEAVEENYPGIYAPFSLAADKIIKADFSNSWCWKNRLMNPSKTMYADLYIEHTTKSAICTAIIKKKHGEMLIPAQLFSTTPDEREYARYLGKAIWIDDSTLQLVDKNGSAVCSITI